MSIGGPEKAAFLMFLVGHELAARLFVGLSRSEQALLMRSMLKAYSPTDIEIEQLSAEFLQLCAKKSGSVGLSLKAPEGTFAGVELPRVSRVSEICDDIPDWVLIDHLKNQLDSVVSAVLGSLLPQRASAIFKAMPEKRQSSLLLSLSQERVLEAGVLDELEADLEELKNRSAAGRYGQRIGGAQRVLSLVQALDQETRERILEDIGSKEPELAKQIEGGMLSVARLATLLPNHLALLLAQMKDPDIGAFLRGEAAQVQSAYLAALSKSRREEVQCLLVPEKKMTQKQKAEACERLRFCALQMKGEGKIIFPWEESLVS